MPTLLNQLVKYSAPIDAEEATFRFVCVEDNGDRVVIEDASGEYALAPQETVAREDVTLA